MTQKLKGEFICFEVRDKHNPKKTIAIDVFYNGVWQYRHNFVTKK